MSKQSSQGTKFNIASAIGTPSANVTAATKAAPPQLSWATIPATLAEGDAVVPAGFGWKSIDNRVFLIDNVVTNTAKLYGADTTQELNAATLGNVSEVTWGESCMATITVSRPAGTVIDVTTLCDKDRETIDGLPAVSTWQATGFWDASDTMQDRLMSLYKSQAKVPIMLTFPDGSGLLFMGTVNQFDTTIGIDAAVAITTGGNISGPVTRIPVGGVAAAGPASPQVTQAGITGEMAATVA